MSEAQTSNRTCIDCYQGAIVGWGPDNSPVCLDHFRERLGFARRTALTLADIMVGITEDTHAD